MRKREKSRETKETSIHIAFDPDGSGVYEGSTGIPFLDHMLGACAKHGIFDLSVQAKGDLDIDCHHVIEDIGIVLGQTIKEAMGAGEGIRRFSHTAVPMDDALAQATLDCGGRGYLVFSGTFSDMPVGGIPGDLFEHFFYSLCVNAGITAHISFYGKNDHHKCEAIFKAFGISLGEALTIVKDRSGIPSTKGTL